MSLSNNENIGRPDEYKQVCVWPGIIIADNQIENFENFFSKEGFRVQFLESIQTKPDRDESGDDLRESGGRIDAIFAVHNDDVMKFAIPRLQMGIRWIEDVLDNEARETEHSIYPERVKEYRTW